MKSFVEEQFLSTGDDRFNEQNQHRLGIFDKN